MSDAKWDIYLLGETQLGVERSTLVRNLATLFKKDVPVIEKMLRKSRSLLKANVDLATARKYQAAIDKAGGLCELVEHGEQLFPNDALSPIAPRPTLSVTPIESAAAPVSAPASHPDHAAISYSSPYESPQADVSGPSRFCFKCGAALYAGMSRCPSCNTLQPNLRSKSKVTAGFLAFFIGGFGIHRFYLGQWWGIFYLLFWGSLIPSIISIIEAFVFWFSSDERWQRKYGQVPEKGPGMVVALIVGAILFVSIIGILAAIALPAYQDYTIRAKVNAAAPLVEETRATVENVILEKNFFPSENIMAGLPENISTPHVRSIRLSAGAKLVVTYNALSAGKAPTIVWTPKKSGNSILWDCKGGTMQDKHRSPECRGGAGAKADTTTAQPKKPITDLRIYSDDKTVSLVVPASWKGNRQLNENAILGVANTSEANYALVMTESKESFDDSTDAATYLSLIVENLQAGSSDFSELQQARTVVINKKPARQQVVALTVQGEKIVYILTTLETDTHFYALYAWTVESLYPQNQDTLRKVSESFSIY